MLVGITLAVMIVLMIFSILTGNSIAGITTTVSSETSGIVNGTTTTFGDTYELVFYLGEDLGLMIFTAIIAIALIAGFQIFGSGLNEEATRILIQATVYGAIWVMLSIMVQGLIVSIEIFGLILYLMLTFLYIVGVVKKMFGGDED